jgi:glycosyltransferase involved in cell wall biosynthesis
MTNSEKTIIHISFDFPDCIDSHTTKAVQNLIYSQVLYRNIVFSLNRTPNPFADFSYKKEPHGYSFNIFGLPFGIGLRVWMYMAAKKIDKIIKKENIELHAIHGHKLTFEGLITSHLAKKYSVPYIISLRGYTDIKLINILRHNRHKFLRTLQNAQKVIFLAPWTRNAIQLIFKDKIPSYKSVMLPNIIQLRDTTEVAKDNRFPDKFVTVFHLDSYKLKNIKRTILAMNAVHNQYPQLKLDIIGGGKSAKIIKSYIQKCTYPSNFKLVGNMAHEEVLEVYGKYLGLILPSFPETFGLVFIEALHAGIPVLFSKNSGIDGYFDDFQVYEKVKYDSVQEIEAGIIKLYEKNTIYRQSIQLLKAQGAFQTFSKGNISKRYTNLLASVLH